MNRALWQKAIREARVQLIVSSVILVLFGWLLVWLMSFIPTMAIRELLKNFPKVMDRFLEAAAGVPVDQITTSAGRLSILYSHVITILVCIGWAVGRGSDVVSGEITRGTMDLLLALPIRRVEVVFVAAVVAAVGAVVLAVAVWVGAWIGVATTHPPEAVSPTQLLPGMALAPPPEPAASEPVRAAIFWPGVFNLAAMTFCLAGLTTLLSSWDDVRWRTIWLAGGLFVVSFAVKMVARLWPRGDWLKYLSFLTPFEPQHLILMENDATAGLAWRYDAMLVGIGLLGYAAAAVVFARRDIPAAH